MGEDLGGVLRDGRKASNMGFATFAKLAGFSQSHLRSVENGTRKPTPEVVRAYDRVLSTGGRFIRQLHEDGDVKRRTFFGLAGALLAADSSSGHVLGHSDVERLRDRFARLRELDSHLGGTDTLRLYTTELARTEELLIRGSGASSVRTSLIELVAEQAQQAGWAAYDAGQLETAVDLYDYSRQAAIEVGSSELAANADIQIAYARADRKPPSLSAIISAGQASQTQALLSSRLGLILAMRGDFRGALHAIDQASDALGKGAGQAPVQHWAAWVDQTELDIVRGRIYVHLRQPKQAADLLTKALGGYPDQWARDKALYCLSLADAYGQMGELSEAVTIAGRAATLSSRTSSLRPKRQAQRTVGRLAALGAPGLGQLQQQLAGSSSGSR